MCVWNLSCTALYAKNNHKGYMLDIKKGKEKGYTFLTEEKGYTTNLN